MKEIYRNIGKLLSANVLAQAIGLLIYPLLTRMFAPEDFGLFNLFASIGGVLILLATMEWYNAIVLPTREEQARAVVHLSLISILAITVLLLLSLPFATPIAQLFNAPQLARYYWLMPLYVALMSSWNVLNYWYIRRKAYGRISGYQISQSLFSAGWKTGFGSMGVLSGGLLYSLVLAPFCSLVISIALSAKEHMRHLFRFDKQQCRQAAVAYANFPKYSTPKSLLNYMSGNLPILMLSPVFGLTELGFVGMALTLAFTPIQIIIRSIYQVFYERIVRKVNTRQPICPAIAKYIAVATMVTIPVFVGLYVILPWLTELLLGSAWRVSGEYIRFFLPWILMVVLTGALNFLPDIFGKQKLMLVIEIAYLALRVLALMAGIHMNSIEWALRLFSYSGVLILGAELIWFLALAKKHDRQTKICN